MNFPAAKHSRQGANSPFLILFNPDNLKTAAKTAHLRRSATAPKAYTKSHCKPHYTTIQRTEHSASIMRLRNCGGFINFADNKHDNQSIDMKPLKHIINNGHQQSASDEHQGGSPVRITLVSESERDTYCIPTYGHLLP